MAETPNLHTSVTLPNWVTDSDTFMQELLAGHPKYWDKVVATDLHCRLGYVIAVDPKWEDWSDIEQLHLLLVARQGNIHSLRDLHSSHLSLLEFWRRQAYRIVFENFNLAPRELKMFLHYPPSVPHLHIHICHRNACDVRKPRVNILNKVINNIRKDKNYYQRATLRFKVYESNGDGLYEAFVPDYTSVPPPVSLLQGVKVVKEGERESRNKLQTSDGSADCSPFSPKVFKVDKSVDTATKKPLVYQEYLEESDEALTYCLKNDGTYAVMLRQKMKVVDEYKMTKDEESSSGR